VGGGDWWAAINALALACGLVTALSYLLSQVSFVRRWLMGDRRPVHSLLLSLSFGVITAAGELVAPAFALIPRNVRYIAPVIGGMYGGPAVGVGQGVVFLLLRAAFRGGWPDAGALVPLVVGFVAGVLSQRFSYRLTVWRAAFITGSSLLTNSLLNLLLEGVRLREWLPELGLPAANFLTIMIVARIFQNERAKEENRRILEELALTDGLTHLANHRQFHTQLAEEIETARVRGSRVALVMLDIDCFKNYNDAFGHPEGDKLLVAISEAVGQTIRSGDTASRYGGDEFALILPNTDFEAAQTVARRIQEMVNHRLRQDGQGKKTGVSLSAGVAIYPDSATDKDALIKRADEALYAAKHSKTKIEIYHSVFDDLKSQLDSSELSLINTVKTLLTVINAKDRYTCGHSERVVHHCLLIARYLDLEENQVKLLRIAAFLHDIGKIEIARDILNKEAPLTQEERRIIEQHPIWGAEIIRPVRSLQQIVPAVLHHHERYDGRGYPDRLKSSSIPLLARILTVADAFDAMTTERPYQRARTVPAALDELKRCSGSQFDPWVLDAFAASLLEWPASAVGSR
jgi:diguanylate cyclase (GGDEF)-like protein/putative nucleotidyltransferase with HDIG domain